MNVTKVAIVTDSTADIPSDLAQIYQIQVVPNLVIINGQSYEDGKGISREEFYTRLPAMDTHPTTATASSGTYHQLYDKLLLQGASQIISIHAAARLSGIINAASAAARAFGERVHVLDSGQVSLGLGFQVLAAAELSLVGASRLAILERIEQVRRKVHLVAMLDTLEYVRRSGRVSWARARLGNLLHIKPFIELRDGEVLSMGEVRTRRKGIEHLKQVLFELGPLERLAILHTNAESEAKQFLSETNLPLPSPPLVVNITTVVGAHVGPNGLGFTAVLR
jgi:DegV family protein with EDD domain